MLKKKLLLADDDVDDRNFFYDFFKARKDIELMPPAENGIEVIEFLNGVPSDTDLPDLIILDHNMPRMNGKQTLEALKSTDRYAAIPIIIYSTYSSKQLVDECSTSGATLVATKPNTYEGYQIMINKFLSVL